MIKVCAIDGFKTLKAIDGFKTLKAIQVYQKKQKKNLIVY
jgi:hypothetical protein